VQNSTEKLNASREKMRARKQGIRKYLSRNTSLPHLRLGGLCYEERGNQCKGEESRQNYEKKKYKEQVLSIFLSLYPKFSAIASGATPIGSAVTHPIEKSQQKRMEKSGNR
jgi:hypothetical protein